MVESITRQIQYFGLIIPEYEQGKFIKWWRLTADIIRPQISRYRNDRYPEFQTFYGYVQYFYEGRIFRTDAIQYNNAYIGFDYNVNGFLHAAISCQLEATLTSFENQNRGLGLTNVARNNPVKSWSHLFIYPQEIKIRMLTPNNVMSFTFEHEMIEDCLADNSLNPPPPVPPPAPPPPPEQPADTPDASLAPNSTAYDGDDDNGETYKPGNPNDLGEPAPEGSEPPIGNECTKYRVSGRAFISDERFIDFDGLHYGPIIDVFLEDESVKVTSKGYLSVTSPDQECQDGFVTREVVSNNIFKLEDVLVFKEE